MNKRPNDAVPEAVPPADRRIAALRQAAQDKHQQAVQRAEAGIRRLVKEGEEINFRAVARAAGVSLVFLHAHTDLRNRIETLRGQQRAENQSSLQAPSADDGAVIHPLTGPLRRERTTHRERVQELEQRLAAAHGEILRLQRVIQSHNPRP
ncbi:DUF6262 family protein [Streptomyces sp. NRRL S-340]|uniref:DUF6262 family protein n=1 Tax=Streptomyces sp. NRRL S-340 TaxID=1463901 RepID=UPI0007C50DFA|nr:DUF6262 family protein [Streptomyces sp. NRRL S-340]